MQGPGGTISGSLAAASHDLPALCADNGAGDHVVRFEVPGLPGGASDAGADVVFDLRGTEGDWLVASLLRSDCHGVEAWDCFYGGQVRQTVLPSGEWYLVLQLPEAREGGGDGEPEPDYRVTVAVRDPESEECLLQDGDGDGVTVCDNDCDDADEDVHPGVEELCDGRDQDCSGVADDLRRACDTPLPGPCRVGEAYCDHEGEEACRQTVEPVEELCDDELDNDCDGAVDEDAPDNDCLRVTEGEPCAWPFDLGHGGTVGGSLADAGDDVVEVCMEQPAAEHVVRFEVPRGEGPDEPGGAEVTLETHGSHPAVVYGLAHEGCTQAEWLECFDGSDEWLAWLPPGVWYVQVQLAEWWREWDAGEPEYRLTVALRDPVSGACLTADADGDEVTLCDGDCDDADGDVHPGAPEVCNGEDTDCNGRVDDLSRECDTGEPGACAVGRAFCDAEGAEDCEQIVFPGPEICNDGVDGDCDGVDPETPEDGECVVVDPGETCELPHELGHGGTVEGSLAEAGDDLQDRCIDGATRDHVIRFEVPQPLGEDVEPLADVLLDTRGTSGHVGFTLVPGDCRGGEGLDCFEGATHRREWLRSGPWFLVVELPDWWEEGMEGAPDYRVTVAIRDPDTGACLTPDGDGDWATVCDDDCDDGDPAVFRGAEEACDGKDSDCNGQVDDVRGECVTGEPGACEVGQTYCNALGEEACRQTVFPRPEVCDDGVDNDCDGVVDEAGGEDGCLTPGEVCEAPIDLGQGGTAVGTLAEAVDDVPIGCWRGRNPDHVLRFEVPDGEWPEVWTILDTSGSSDWVVFGLLSGECERGELVDCFEGGERRELGLPPGEWFLVAEAPEWWEDEGVESVDYRVTVALRDPWSGECLTPSLDGDEFTVCDGDCDDTDAAVFPRAPERCDGQDTDCNGRVDDLRGECDTGEPGPCGRGRAFCEAAGQEGCEQVVFPAAEFCGDGIDSDCDGADPATPDDGECIVVEPGETCDLPLDLGHGGTASGTLVDALDAVQSFCMEEPSLERVIRFDVPEPRGPFPDEGVEVVIDTSGSEDAVVFNLVRDGCVGGELWGCFGAGRRETRLPPGEWFLVAELPDWWVDEGEGPGGYRVTVAIRDPDTGECLTPSDDGDEFTVCDGDCDDGDGGVHPEAAEVCDGRDTDCNGRVDDLRGGCETGLLGVCNAGRRFCDGEGEEACEQTVFPRPEVCGDGVNNDCDADGADEDSPDDPCVPLGERCEQPYALGLGGTAAGSLADATDDEPDRCGRRRAPEHVLRFEVPDEVGEAGVEVVVDGRGSSPWVTYALIDGDCRDGESWGCFESGGVEGFRLWPGEWFVMLELPEWWADEGGGEADYRVTVSMRDVETGECLTPNQDGDDFTVCDGDCDDDDGDVFPGAEERCDGRDSDCNGRVDDLRRACDTGEPGPCALGQAFCDGDGAEACDQTVFAEPEICDDGIDSDCDGIDPATPDEADCIVVEPGESCELPLELGAGGVAEGSLAEALDLVEGYCDEGGSLEHVLRFEVPAPDDPRDEPGAEVVIDIRGSGEAVTFSLVAESCHGGEPWACLRGSERMEEWLPSGAWFLVVELPGWWLGEGGDPADGDYRVTVATRDPDTGECLLPQGDDDGVTVCDGDCDDADAEVHPGADEACDGRDTDCNGRVDDVRGECDSGEPGPCAAGRLACDEAGELTCEQLVFPAPELCDDGVNNDCDADGVDEDMPDDPCVGAPGEMCALPLDLGDGGRVEGALGDAVDDHELGDGCGASDAVDHVLSFEVPEWGSGVFIDTTGSDEAIVFNLMHDVCPDGEVRDCWFGGHRAEYWLDGGIWYLVVESERPDVHYSIELETE